MTTENIKEAAEDTIASLAALAETADERVAALKKAKKERDKKRKSVLKGAHLALQYLHDDDDKDNHELEQLDPDIPLVGLTPSTPVASQALPAPVEQLVSPEPKQETDLERRQKQITEAAKAAPAPAPTTPTKVLPAPQEEAEPQEKIGLPKAKTTEAPSHHIAITDFFRGWQWGPVAWIFALVALLVSVLIQLGSWESFFPGRPEWLRYVAAILINVFVFFVFGWIGALIDRARAQVKIERIEAVRAKENPSPATPADAE